MPKEASELVRLNALERDLIFSYRRCSVDRQDVLQNIAGELSKQTSIDSPQAGNVVLLAGRKLSQ